MDISQLQQYLAFTNILLSFFLSFAILKSKLRGKNWLSLLLTFIGFFSLLQLGYLLGSYIILVFLPVIIFPLISSLGVALLFYINKTLFNEDPTKIKRYLIVPLLLSLFHIIFVIIFNKEFTPLKIQNLESIHPVYSFIIIIILVVYNTIFFICSGIKVFKYRHEFKDNYSNDKINNVWWLTIFVILNFMIYPVVIGVVIYHIVNGKGIPFSIIEEITIILVLFTYIYYLIIKPEILLVEHEKAEQEEKNVPKYQKMNLPEEMRTRYARKLEEYMIEKQAFTNENISVKSIAEELKIKSHHLSMTINIEFGKNFYNYINEHRIRYAETLLKDPKITDSILEVAFNSGFQSKTSFNKSFKTITGMTPTQFRKQQPSS